MAAAGAGAAIGATTGDKGKQAEDSILSSAAKQLGVAPNKLRDALGAAEDAQLDQAVKDGDLTQAQADAIKKMRQQSGRVLGIPHPGPPGGPGFERHGFRGGLRAGPGPGPGPGGELGAVAKALGISVDDLFSQLRSGKSLADVAKAKGKSLDDVKKAAKDALSTQLDQAVKDGKLTRSQADDILAHESQELSDLGNGRLRGGWKHRGHLGPPPPGGPPAAFPVPPPAGGDGPPTVVPPSTSSSSS
jgi:hypothetical protein